MGFSCTVLIWIQKSQWKQIFLKIPMSINCFNTYKLDYCLWQDALKCQCYHLTWNSGIQWNLGAILSYSASSSSFTYLCRYLKFRQHNSILQPLQTESIKWFRHKTKKLLAVAVITVAVTSASSSRVRSRRRGVSHTFHYGLSWSFAK